jgi:hypothetical protein
MGCCLSDPYQVLRVLLGGFDHSPTTDHKASLQSNAAIVRHGRPCLDSHESELTSAWEDAVRIGPCRREHQWCNIYIRGINERVRRNLGTMSGALVKRIALRIIHSG